MRSLLAIPLEYVLGKLTQGAKNKTTCAYTLVVFFYNLRVLCGICAPPDRLLGGYVLDLSCWLSMVTEPSRSQGIFGVAYAGSF